MKRQSDITYQSFVFCEDCRHCQRDTSGLSFSIDTGEYFMGTCGKGVGDCGRLARVFINKPRQCKFHIKNIL